MAAGYVPTSPLNTLYTNTTAGTPADPTAVDGAVQAIVQTVNDNYDSAQALNNGLSNHKNATTLDHPDQSVTTAKIKDANVTSAKLASSSVTTAKVADANITTAKLLDAAVTEAKLADDSVTAAKIVDSAVGTDKIAPGAVTNDRIANGAVGSSKIDPALLESYGTIAINAKFDEVDEQLADIAINVKTFGAVGDGVTNDTQSFQDAFDYIGTTGQTLLVPEGTFIVDPSVLVMPINLRITGSNYLSCIIKSSGPTTVGYGLQTSTSCEISNLYIRGFGVGILNMSHWIKIYDNKLSYNEVGIDFNTNSYIVKCLNNEITFNAIGVLIRTQSYQLVIENNIIDNNNLGVGISGSSMGFLLRGNTIEGNRNYTSLIGCGVLMTCTTASRSEISGNWFESNGTDGVKSVDVMLSPYHPTPALQDTYAMDLYNTIISECVPASYQALFTNMGIGVGTINLSSNSHLFTKHGVVVGGHSGVKTNITGCNFKGILDVYNISVYIGFKINNPVNILNSTVNNSDNSAINTQMLMGFQNTFVYPTTNTTTKVSYNSYNLFSNTGIGTENPTQKLDVLGQNFKVGADQTSAITRTDATAKLTQYLTPHYTNAQADVLELIAVNSVSANVLGIGGGSGSFNAATNVSLYTAPNATTKTGTKRLEIDSAGRVSVKGETFAIETTKTPASATATGVKGDIVWDENYLYVCVATNTWKRTALTTW